MRILLLALAVLIPITTMASNAGIVRGLWYSTENFFVDQPIRIYVAVRNNTGADLSGTVEFFVNGEKIERKNIDALDGRIVESWADWNPSYGTSSITATLSRTELSSTASGTQAVEVVSALAEDRVFVDYDTDNDQIGNLIDEDDDNDGISDRDEEIAGTDPLTYDEPVVIETTDSEDRNASGTTTVTSDDDPTGLERYLTPSPANTFLTNVTDLVNQTKKKIDDYIVERNEELNPETAPNIEVNNDGFGEIERTSQSQSNLPKAEKPEGFFGDILTFFGNIFTGVYSIVLAATAFAFGYPSLIQILLLLLILFILYRVAKKFGGRPE